MVIMGSILTTGIVMLIISILLLFLGISITIEEPFIMGCFLLLFGLGFSSVGIIIEKNLNKMTNPGIIISVDTEEFPNSKIECLKVEDGFVKFTDQKDTLVVTLSYWKNNIIDDGKVINNKNL